MTVQQLIEKLVTLGPRYASYIVDARYTADHECGLLSDCLVDDFFTIDLPGGDGYLTLLLGEPS